MVPYDKERGPKLVRERDQAIRRMPTFDRYLGVLGRSDFAHQQFRCAAVRVSMEHMRVEQRQLVALGQLARDFDRAGRDP
jgi:hypothetical protein